MLLIKRPIFLLWILLMGGILIWNSMRKNEIIYEEGEICCEGIVDDFQQGSSGESIVLSDLSLEGASKSDKLIIYIQENESISNQIQIGNQIQIKGTMKNFEEAGNPGEFQQKEYYECRKIKAKVFAKEYKVKRNQVRVVKQKLFVIRKMVMQRLRTVMGENDAGILGAMLLGDKSYLPEEEKTLYQKTGIGHMLAISGLHISLIGAGLFEFLRKYILPMRIAAFTTILFLLCYGQFTGFPIATTRAVIMMILILLARYLGECYDALTAMALSGIITLLQEPLQLFQCGFLLSYAAMSGILLFIPVFEKWKIENKILQSLISGASVFLVTLPIMLWFYYEICPYSILVNGIVLPILSILILVGIIGCIIMFVWPPGSEFILATAHYILQFYKLICQVVERLPFHQINTGRPAMSMVIIYYLVLVGTVVCFICLEKQKVLYLGTILLLGILFFFPSKFEFLYSQLDVGQGDGACLFYGDKTILIDGGSSSKKSIGEYVIKNYLKYYGRRKIDAIFITHSDGDHVSGLEELAEKYREWNLEIGTIYLPGLKKQDDNLLLLKQKLQKNQIEVKELNQGQKMSMGEFKIECMHPSYQYEWGSENDYSLTLKITYRQLDILTTGDLEESGEQEILNELPQCEILKVGHHGSKSSTSEEFLRRVHPYVALISAGKNNRYGHPHDTTIEKLQSCGAQIRNTAKEGTLMIEMKKGELQITGWKTKSQG